MNHFRSTASSMARTLAPDVRIMSGPMVGSLLGPEWIVCTPDKYFRVGSLTVNQIKRGVPVDELELLECDESGEPIDEAA